MQLIVIIRLPYLDQMPLQNHFFAARKVKEVNEIQTFLGRVDVRLNILARDMAHYQEIYRSQILLLPHISDIEALMVITNVMTKDGVPL